MADVFNGTTGTQSPLVQTAFDTTVAMFLNDMAQFRSVADKKPVAQAMPGAVVTLTIQGQMDPVTTPLDEVVDVAAVALPAPRQLNVTLVEYGNAAVTTIRLQKEAFSASVIKDQSFTIADNLNWSVDAIYRTVLDGAANKLWVKSDGSFVTADPTSAYGTITGASVNACASLLKGRLAPRRDGVNYVSIIHPNVSYDLRNQVGMNSWLQPRAYVDTGQIYSGEVGTFQGVRFIESRRTTVVAGTPNLYNSYVLGREAVVEATAIEPHVVIGPVTDRLKRLTTVGWHALFGVSIYRNNSLQLVKTTSTLDGLNGTFDPKA